MQVELVEALRAAIEAAWKDAQYPGDLHVRTVTTSSCSSLLIDVDTGDKPLVNILAPRPKDSHTRDNLDAFRARVDALTEEQKRIVSRLFTYWRAKDWISDRQQPDRNYRCFVRASRPPR
jgi:hypothetical protein